MAQAQETNPTLNIFKSTPGSATSYPFKGTSIFILYPLYFTLEPAAKLSIRL